MHESVKAKEIENKIIARARKKGISEIKKVVIKAGRAAGESPSELRHIIKDHMKIKQLRIISEDAALKCLSCGAVITERPDSLACRRCGSIENEIISGMAYEIIEVE